MRTPSDWELASNAGAEAEALGVGDTKDFVAFEALDSNAGLESRHKFTHVFDVNTVLEREESDIVGHVRAFVHQYKVCRGRRFQIRKEEASALLKAKQFSEDAMSCKRTFNSKSQFLIG